MITPSKLWNTLVMVALMSESLNSFIQFNRLSPMIYKSFKKSNTFEMVATTSLPPSSQSQQQQQQPSLRLKKAQLRLAEAQGRIPIGASDDPSFTLDLQSAPLSLSRVREIQWRVAEPAVSYDPVAAASKLFAQPIKWLIRNVQFLLPVAIFFSTVILDILTNKEEINRLRRADELLDLISAQSPALIKAGQALASRSDLLPKEYLDSLQKLQDRCPAYPTSEAFKLFESELNCPFNDLIELDTPEPIAAASIGQVYKGRLKSNGAQVAIKIQRPGCEELIAVDLFILRWYASLVQKILVFLKRDVDLVAIIDDFGELIYREIDYRAEAVNAQRFAELYSTIPLVFVPKVYTQLSTSKVLVMEWVDGARLNDKERLSEMGLDGTKFVDTLVQCSLRQLLENGFFHADPHAGNLLAMPSGKLCYLDFGMVSYVESAQRLSIIEAIVHLVNRDFVSLANLYKRMGFIPQDVDSAPIIAALENALPDVLSASVGDFNFKNVIGKLGDVMYTFPFSLPPYYIAIIRCLGVLEGLAIQVDPNFRIIKDAYPYIASRLLTDPSVELQQALRQLLFKDGKPRWDRLEELLEQASSTNDYDFSVALDQGLTFLISDQGKGIRDDMAIGVVDFLDEIFSSTVDYSNDAIRDFFTSLFTNNNSNTRGSGGSGSINERIQAVIQSVSKEGFPNAVLNLLMSVSDGMIKYGQKKNLSTADAAALESTSRLIKILVKSAGTVQFTDNTSRGLMSSTISSLPPPPTASSSSNNGNNMMNGNNNIMINTMDNNNNNMNSNNNGGNEVASEKFSKVIRRALREPVSQNLIARIVSDLSERLAGRTVQRFVLQLPLPFISSSTSSSSSAVLSA